MESPALRTLHTLRTGASLAEPPQLILRGSIEKVVYFNDENGECILDIKPFEMKGHVLVSGKSPSVHPGQTVEALISSDSSYDKFLQSPLSQENEETFDGLMPAHEIHLDFPVSARTSKKFLKSGALKSVGPHLASVLAKAFPENLFAVLDKNPEQLLFVEGIGKKRQKQILEAWEEFKALSKLEEFLFSRNLPLNWARALWPHHQFESRSYLTNQPYQAVLKHSLGFDLVDGFALKEGWAPESPERVRCGLYDILEEFYRQGHCAYPEALLLEVARERLAVPAEIIENALELELLAENLILDEIGTTSCVYMKGVWELERNVAQRLLQFQGQQPPWGWFNMQKVLGWAQELLKIQLAPLQRQAIETALNSQLTVITGGPGTGKTTLIRSFVTILQTQFAKFALCSPTGRAAQRLEEATGVKAKTIHRLLKYNSDGTFSHHQKNPLDLDLVLIDEASMVDLSLMSHLLDALPRHCALILVGDADQIPPVGAGHILQSVIASGQFTVVRLTDIFRHKEESQIKINAHRINSGLLPLDDASKKSDFHYIPVSNADQAKEVVLDLATRVIPVEYGMTDPSQFQILVPMNRGPLGTQQLNEELQQRISVELTEGSSSDDDIESIGIQGQSLKKGDKVMVVKNDYAKEVFNGDIGFIYQIDSMNQLIEVQFDDRLVRFGFDQLDRLTLAYAISIHKSQGSEYKAVIVVITGDHLPMAQRHLIYTAITRGKELVFLVAEPQALETAVISDENSRRWQKLTELLTPEASRIQKALGSVDQ